MSQRTQTQLWDRSRRIYHDALRRAAGRYYDPSLGPLVALGAGIAGVGVVERMLGAFIIGLLLPGLLLASIWMTERRWSE